MLVLSYLLWVFTHLWAGYPMVLGLYPYEFRGSYRECFSLQALVYYLEREVRLDREVFQLSLVGMLSAQRFTTRFV